MLCCYFDFMDPSTSALAPVDQPATAPSSIINAPGEQVASTRTMPAPHIDAPAEGSIVVDDDSPLTTASGDVFRQLPWDDLGRSFNLDHNLMHARVLSFSFKGSTRSRSSSSPARATTPYLSSIALQDESHQPGRAHPTHEVRCDFAAARAATS